MGYGNTANVGNVSFTEGVRKLFYLVTPNETSFEKVEDVPDYLNEALPFFNGAILLEFVIAWLKGAQRLRLNDSLSSISGGVMMQLFKLVFMSLELVCHAWVYTNLRVADLPWNSPLTWWIAFFAMDFCYYWFHRASHEVNFIWGAHQVHHSSEDYNLTTALRQSIVQHFFSAFIYSSLGIILPPSVFLVHVQFNLIYQFWIHTELIKSLGPLEYIFNCPSHHRVHHGRNPYCIDKNYAGTLIIWDRLFGTFQDETDEKVVYGLVHPVSTWNPIWIQICHFVHIAKTFWAIEGIKNKIFVVIKGPGWTPGKPRLGDPADLPEIEYPVQKYDSSLPLWGNIYVVIHAILFNSAYYHIIVIHLSLTQLHVFLAVMYMVLSLTAIGVLLDRKWYAPYVEILRLVIFLVVDYILSVQQTDVGVIPLHMLGATRIIYMTSAFLWLVLVISSNEKLLDKQD